MDEQVLLAKTAETLPESLSTIDPRTLKGEAR